MSTIRSKAADNGIGGLSKELAFLLRAHATYRGTCERRTGSTFRFGDACVPYEMARFNHSWLNERTIEIAVARHVLSERSPGGVLEVGNVLGHYGIAGHDVLDLYERVAGVRNGDIVSWDAPDRYEAVLAISTLEHVRFDEPEKDPHGPALALQNMRRFVQPGGWVLVTVPLGYNPGLDEDIRQGCFQLDRQHFYRRVSADNDWREVDRDEALGCKYGSVYRNANAIMVGVDDPRPPWRQQP